jgi:hypothetical protein
MHESGRTSGTAFGLALEANFAIPGLHAGEGDLPLVTLTLGDEADLERAWSDAEPGATRISSESFGRGEPDRTIDAHPEIGYRLFARYFGSAVMSPDGARLLCVPPPIQSWRWQRFLVGRCLPLAAMLQGYEVFHAGAVEIDGCVIGLLGPSGAGKTSLTLRLALQGARFFTDDVLTVEVRSDALVAHPGFGVVNVRRTEDESLGADERMELGTPLGRTGRDKRHYAVAPVTGVRPLRAFYFLALGRERAATIVPLPEPEPPRLLTSAFIHDIRPAEHLARLLDVCARLSATVPMFEVSLGRDENAATLAVRLRAHAEHEASVRT